MRPAPNASRLGETLSGSTDLKRSRSLLRALVTASAMSLAACGGGSNGNENPHTGGTGGVAGSAGEGGTGSIGGSAGEGGTGGVAGEGGTGGTDAGDPCANKEFEGLASRVYQPGDSDPEDDPLTVALDDQNPDKAYNGLSLRVKDGAMFIKSTRVGLQRVTYANFQTPGYNSIGTVSGVRPVFMDAAQPYVDDGTGNCVLNRVDVDETVLADTGRRPVMKTPQGYYTTVFRVENNSEALADYTLGSDRTGFGLSSAKADYIMGNSKPSVPDTVSAHRDTDGHVVLSLAGTTDEGFGDDNVLAKLNATASGITLEPVPGQPGKFRSTAPSALTSLNLSVAGLNDGLTDDKTVKSLTVTETDLCIGVDCEDSNECTVDSCDPADGTCDNTPDVGKSCDDGQMNTINDECNAGGVCEGEVVACTTNPQCDDNNPCNGVETCGTNNECVGGTPINYDDGNACNGVETCNPVNGSMVPGTPINYNDGNACNGVETCDPATGNKINGTPINYDDGLVCNGTESCDPVTGNKINGTPINCGTDVCVEPGNCVDETPPNAPVITTNGGTDFTTTNATVGIEGTTDIDTDQMYSKINGGAYSLIPGYTAGSPNWSQTFGISAGQTNTYCFAAEDWSNNRSTADCIVVERAYPAPNVWNLIVDCSGGIVPGSCVADGFPYPATFTATNATSCSAVAERISGTGTAGSTSIVNLNGNNGSLTYTTGSTGGNIIKVTATCNGPGGSDSDSTQFEIQ